MHAPRPALLPHAHARQASHLPRSPGRSHALARALWVVLVIGLSGCQSLPSVAPGAAQAAASLHPAGDGPPALAHPASAPTMAAKPAPASSMAAGTAPAEGADMVLGRMSSQASPAAAAGPSDGSALDLLAAPDLWGRLRRGFVLPALDHPLAEQHARRFAQAGFFTQRADRLRLYLPLIVAELEARNMPLELALLPLVESALNPHARSPVGAVGTWQFMAPTARRFELRTSRLVDDRKNIQAATRAALDYLQRLHGQFGDWHLAMAAYNWGEGRVQTAVNRQRPSGAAADFAALATQMPAETRNYVPQIDALRRLVAEPGVWGALLPDLPDNQPLVNVALSQDTDLALAVRWSGLSERALLAMNPAIKPPLVLAAATPRLLMPEDAAQRFEQAREAHHGGTASWTVLKLPASRPVEAIAQAYGTAPAAVRSLNDIPRGMKPVAGSVLLLPVAPAPGTRAPESVVATAQLDMVADLVKVRTRSRARETLADVARRCEVGTAALASWNGLNSRARAQKLRAGTVLTLWVAREHAPAFERAMAQAPIAAAKDPARPPKPATRRG